MATRLHTVAAAAPYRGSFGAPRPFAVQALPLPPDPMPSHDRHRPLKAWRYVGVYGPELMVCAATARIGRARQSFWAVWDRTTGRLRERTRLGRGRVTLTPGLTRIREAGVQVEIELVERAGIETVCASGDSYAWTRKQGGVRARGTVTLDGIERRLDARAVIDDTAAYYERHTSWCWSAGVGSDESGRAVAWNLVQGVNDPPRDSERTVWIDGDPHEPGPVQFGADLRSVGGLHFHEEAARVRDENLGLIRSRYRQPFGTFTGEPAPGLLLAEGYGVMESHDVWW